MKWRGCRKYFEYHSSSGADKSQRQILPPADNYRGSFQNITGLLLALMKDVDVFYLTDNLVFETRMEVAIVLYSS